MATSLPGKVGYVFIVLLNYKRQSDQEIHKAHTCTLFKLLVKKKLVKQKLENHAATIPSNSLSLIPTP